MQSQDDFRLIEVLQNIDRRTLKFDSSGSCDIVSFKSGGVRYSLRLAKDNAGTSANCLDFRARLTTV